MVSLQFVSQAVAFVSQADKESDSVLASRQKLAAFVSTVLFVVVAARVDWTCFKPVPVVRDFFQQRVAGVPLWTFFGAMLVLSVFGYLCDHLDSVDSGASAFFIDNKTRSTQPSTFIDHVRFWLKILLLLVSLYIEYELLFQPTRDKRQLEKRPPMREWLCLLCGTVFVGRIFAQMALFWSREISWVEVFAEAGGVIPISLAAFAYGAARRRGAPLGIMELLAVPVFLFGTYLNLWPEYTRHVWKSDPANSGHLYVGGLFAFCRHINYFGEVLSFVGFAMASSTWWNLWVPAVMGVGMAVFSVPELDAYLSQKYAAEWVAYSKEVTCQMFPFIW